MTLTWHWLLPRDKASNCCSTAKCLLSWKWHKGGWFRPLGLSHMSRFKESTLFAEWWEPAPVCEFFCFILLSNTRQNDMINLFFLFGTKPNGSPGSSSAIPKVFYHLRSKHFCLCFLQQCRQIWTFVPKLENMIPSRQTARGDGSPAWVLMVQFRFDNLCFLNQGASWWVTW